MTPPAVVEDLDVLEDGGPRVLSGPKVAQVDPMRRRGVPDAVNALRHDPEHESEGQLLEQRVY